VQPPSSLPGSITSPPAATVRLVCELLAGRPLRLPEMIVRLGLGFVNGGEKLIAAVSVFEFGDGFLNSRHSTVA